MRLDDLPVGVLQQVAERAVQDAGLPLRERRAVLAEPRTAPSRLDADQPDARRAHERGEHADRVAAAADARDARRRDPPPIRSAYCARASSPITRCRSRTSNGNGMRADDRADDVVRVAHAGGPVAQRLVHGFLQRAGAGHDRHDLRAEQLHPRDVGRLPMRVLLAHVDDARESEQRAGRGGGDAVLTGSRLRDDPLLAQPLREQRLAERVVDLVRARVRQVLALQPDLVAELRGQPAARA